MCLVPPEELQDVLIRDSFGSFPPEDQEQIGQMVQQGFQTWKDFNDRFAEQQKQIRLQDAGIASWGDVETFLREYSEAQPMEGYSAQRFLDKEGQIQPIEHAVNVLTLGDGESYVCGDPAGALVSGPGGRMAKQLGLNLGPVSEVLRRFAFPTSPAGAAFLRWPRELTVPRGDATRPFGVLAFIRQTVRTDNRAIYVEHGTTLHCYQVMPGSPPVQLVLGEKSILLQGMFEAAFLRNKPEMPTSLIQELLAHEAVLANDLQRPTETERASGIRHAVIPLLAAIVVE